MNKAIEKLVGAAENLDWKCTLGTQEYDGKKEQYLEFETNTPAGEDFIFTAWGQTAQEIAVTVLDAAKQKLTRFGRIPGYAEVNLTFFMIYYIFPAILLTESPYSTAIADALQEEFKVRFKNSNISYADYQTIYDGFNEKILGIF